MAAEDTLRVDPAEMGDCAVSIAGAAEHLMGQLADLDHGVSQMLTGWQGAAGTAYGSAWDLWQRGAQEVRVGLSLLAHGVARAGTAYDHNEDGAARAMRAVRNG